MKVECPQCKKILSVPDNYKNKRIRCRYCKQILKAVPLPIKIVVPVAALPEPKPSEKSPGQDNLFTKIWTKSPVAFRNAFLATLGVLSALLVVYYVYGINKWFQQPMDDIKSYESSLPVEVESAKSLPITDVNAYHLAVLIKLSEYQNSLETMMQIRANAANRIWTSSTEASPHFIVSFFGTLFCLQNQLEKLYINAKNIEVPENKYFIVAHQDLLAAIDAEYSFEKTILNYPQNSDSLYILGQVEDKGKQLVELCERSSISLSLLYLAIDPNLLNALTQRIKENN